METDQKIADFFVRHLQDPCECPEGNIGEFYIREAGKVILTFSNEEAIEQLSQAIRIREVLS